MLHIHIVSFFRSDYSVISSFDTLSVRYFFLLLCEYGEFLRSLPDVYPLINVLFVPGFLSVLGSGRTTQTLFTIKGREISETMDSGEKVKGEKCLERW